MSTDTLAIGIVGAVLVFWMLGAYNRLMALRNAIGTAWQPLEEVLRQRQGLLQPLVEVLQQLFDGDDRAAVDALRGALLQVQAAAWQVRQRPAQKAAVTALAAAEKALAVALARVIAVLEHHPTVRDTLPPVAKALPRLPDIEARRQFGRHGFNQAAQSYNAAARQFPTHLLLPLFRFGAAGLL
jgi:LemA protein